MAGGTRAVDFPVAMPAQAANAGLGDIFAATISADGSKLNYSTYFGGTLDDGAPGATLDSQGNVILVGQTWSNDFPNAGGLTLPFSYRNAFVMKLAAPGLPVITSVLNGASLLPGIEAGSWVTIKGSNLANTCARAPKSNQRMPNRAKETGATRPSPCRRALSPVI